MRVSRYCLDVVPDMPHAIDSEYREFNLACHSYRFDLSLKGHGMAVRVNVNTVDIKVRDVLEVLSHLRFQFTAVVAIDHTWAQRILERILIAILVHTVHPEATIVVSAGVI